MKVTVKLRASLKRFSKTGESTVVMELIEGQKIRAIIEELGIPETDFGLITVNGCLTETDQLLKEGDSVELFTMLKGG